MSRSRWGEAPDEPARETAREDARPTDTPEVLRVADPRSGATGARHGFPSAVAGIRGGRDILRSGHQAGERVHRTGEVQGAKSVSCGFQKHRCALRDGGDGDGVIVAASERGMVMECAGRAPRRRRFWEATSAFAPSHSGVACDLPPQSKTLRSVCSFVANDFRVVRVFHG